MPLLLLLLLLMLLLLLLLLLMLLMLLLLVMLLFDLTLCGEAWRDFDHTVYNWLNNNVNSSQA